MARGQTHVFSSRPSGICLKAISLAAAICFEASTRLLLKSWSCLDCAMSRRCSSLVFWRESVSSSSLWTPRTRSWDGIMEMCFGNCDSTTRNAWETGSPRATLHIETGYVLSIHIHPNDVSPAPPTPRNGSAPPTGGSYPSRLKKHVAIPRVFVLVSASPGSHSHNLRDTKMFDQRWWDDEISEILAGPCSQFVFWTVLSVSIFGEHLLWLAQGKYCRIDSSYLSI